jgi:lysylphosphatidylglycerol synthetase-like protein (DUF2156 family)
MAPLSGFEQSAVAPLRNPLGAFVYDHGESVDNFRGLRAYEEKFNPVWEPHYLAHPGPGYVSHASWPMSLRSWRVGTGGSFSSQPSRVIP